MKILPEKFIMLTEEGLSRVIITAEQIYSIDALIAKLGQEKQLIFTRLADHPNGIMHMLIRTSERPRRMPVLELTQGYMVLSTQYHAVITGEGEWVSPCFIKNNNSFLLRCKFEFSRWSQCGLRMFLALQDRSFYLWVYFDGQIYRPPFGNVFDSCQLCLGHNEGLLAKAFDYQQTHSATFSKGLQLLSDSEWNQDVFPSQAKEPLDSLVRFDAGSADLPMLEPLTPSLIKNMPVAANKDFAEITAQIVIN